MPDPRPEAGGRVLTLCGMGVPGAFGSPELTVLVRELVWSLGKLGKRHLASAPIGTRNSNIPAATAVEAWVRGVVAALSGAAVPESQDVDWITFYLPDPRIIPEVDRAFQAARTYPGLDLDYRPLSKGELRWLREKILAYERRELERRMNLEQACWEAQVLRGRRADAPELDVGPLMPEPGRPGRRPEDDPVRVTVRFARDDSHGRGAYQFGAITQAAAIPMRQIDVDPTLIEQANRELAAAFDPAEQYRHGRFLGQLLLPRDFRDLLQTAGPIILMVDSASAQIHWELIARPDLWARLVDDDGGPPPADEEDPAAYLGTSRGLTRQLLTGFAPPPEPPPPSRRTLRALIVADPAGDHPLPGARREGLETLELFRRFGPAWAGSGNRVEVDALIGPTEATRTNVLRRLMSRTYDVFHYAGHCVFDADDPPASGLLFDDGRRLSALELRRIDRVPRFVFLNACESGTIPDLRRPLRAGPGAELRRGVLRAGRVELRLHGLAGRRRRGRRLLAAALPRPARPGRPRRPPRPDPAPDDRPGHAAGPAGRRPRPHRCPAGS